MWVSHKIFKLFFKKMWTYHKKRCRILFVGGNSTKQTKNRGEEMTIEEKAQIVSKIFAALDIVPKEQKDQLTGIIIGYSMASQFKESKGA